MPLNTIISNFAVINPRSVALFLRANKNTRCSNCTIIGSRTNTGVVADMPSQNGDGLPTVYFENTLSLNNTLNGFRIVNQADWKIEYSNAYGNGRTNFTPSSNRVVHSQQIDPQLGTCRVFIPDSSPMKGAGKAGADIGANILYVYANGTLTDKPLWNPQTGQFPCGAIVPGVNDIPGQSCFDVHTRVNVHTNGCKLPATYKGPWPPPPGPTPQ
jgi:hypothetical protein